MFATTLKTLRLRARMTQEGLAARSGVHAGQITGDERGLTPTVDAVVRLAQALGVDPQEMMGPVIAAAVANSPTLPPQAR